MKVFLCCQQVSLIKVFLNGVASQQEAGGAQARGPPTPLPGGSHTDHTAQPLPAGQPRWSPPLSSYTPAPSNTCPTPHKCLQQRPGPGHSLPQRARAPHVTIQQQPRPHRKLPEVGTGLQDRKEQLQPTSLASKIASGLARPFCFAFRSHRPEDRARTSCLPSPHSGPQVKGGAHPPGPEDTADSRRQP